jgi:hypothetical protein
MEINFEPYKKITFQSHLFYESLDEFIDVIVSGSPAGVPFQGKLFWANGVLFRFFNHPHSEALSKEILSGHLIFDHIEFSPMPDFQSEITSTNRPLGRIVVVNVSKHVVFNPLTAWLRDNFVKKP